MQVPKPAHRVRVESPIQTPKSACCVGFPLHSKAAVELRAELKSENCTGLGRHRKGDGQAGLRKAGLGMASSSLRHRAPCGSPPRIMSHGIPPHLRFQWEVGQHCRHQRPHQEEQSAAGRALAELRD